MNYKRLGNALLGPPEVSNFTKGAITLVCMTGSCLAGFYFQQRLIENYFSGDKAEVRARAHGHMRLASHV